MSQVDDTRSTEESRQRPRFLIRPRVPATFSGVPVSVLDLSATGLRVEHATPMRLSATGSIQLETEENSARVTCRGRVVWSRLSRVTDNNGKLLYQSGVRLEEVPDSVAGLFGRVIHLFGERDSQSIVAKRAVMAARASSRASHGTSIVPVKAASPKVRISADDVRAIREAEETLKNDPHEAQQWVNRARYSTALRCMHESPEGMVPYPREVIVIWEYLGGRIELDAILTVLDQNRPG